MRCEHEKTFTRIHVIVFLLVHFCFETASVCIELISVCAESTSDVYQNRLPFVSKRLCIEISVHLKSVPDCIAHTHDAMHFGIDTRWRTDDAKERYSFIYNCSAIKEITLTLEN